MTENKNQSNSKEPKRFNTVNAADLLAQEFEPLQFAVEKILHHGLFILAGRGKIGKSWLALDIYLYRRIFRRQAVGFFRRARRRSVSCP